MVALVGIFSISPSHAGRAGRMLRLRGGSPTAMASVASGVVSPLNKVSLPSLEVLSRNHFSGHLSGLFDCGCSTIFPRMLRGSFCTDLISSDTNFTLIPTSFLNHCTCCLCRLQTR
jgi:hypothetical protein